jgi:hypothetical protein
MKPATTNASVVSGSASVAAVAGPTRIIDFQTDYLAIQAEAAVSAPHTLRQISHQLSRAAKENVAILRRCGTAAAFDAMLIVVPDLNMVPQLTSQAEAQGATGTKLMENECVTVMRMTAPRGLAQEMHKSPTESVAIQVSPGRIEVAVGDERTGRRAQVRIVAAKDRRPCWVQHRHRTG